MVFLTEFRPPADELAAFEKRKQAMSTTRRNLRVILSVGLLAVCGAAYAGGPFEIDWHTIDGGGKISSTGGGFEMSATIGQADAGVLTGGGFQLTGGFWFEQPPGDCNATGIADLLDHADFADCLSGPGGGLLMPDCNCFDVDADNDADLLDFAELQVAFNPS